MGKDIISHKLMLLHLVFNRVEMVEHMEMTGCVEQEMELEYQLLMVIGLEANHGRDLNIIIESIILKDHQFYLTMVVKLDL